MSDIANDIVDQVFAGDKSAAVDTVGTAIQDRAYELIQQKKIEIAQQWGFDLDQTGQGAADEVSDSIPDGSDTPQDVEVDGRMPHDPPAAETELETTEPQETENETDLGTD
jgi:hypothetical protein